MLFYEKSISDIDRGPKTLFNAADHADKPLAEESMILSPGIEFNACDIQDKLIQITGRFCERYASDLIVTFANLQPFLTCSELPAENRWIIGIGIRASGVDGNAFIIERLLETRTPLNNYIHPERCYRKLLAIDITDTEDDGNIRRTIALKDITTSAYILDPSDLPKTERG